MSRPRRALLRQSHPESMRPRGSGALLSLVPGCVSSWTPCLLASASLHLTARCPLGCPQCAKHTPDAGFGACWSLCLRQPGVSSSISSKVQTNCRFFREACCCHTIKKCNIIDSQSTGTRGDCGCQTRVSRLPINRNSSHWQSLKQLAQTCGRLLELRWTESLLDLSSIASLLLALLSAWDLATSLNATVVLVSMSVLWDGAFVTAVHAQPGQSLAHGGRSVSTLRGVHKWVPAAQCFSPR